MKTDFDGAWKRALLKFLPHAFRLLFPDAFERIDWSRGFVFLDKELERAARDTQFPKLRVDKLVRIYLKDGGRLWILIHIEVQSQRDPKFALRMYVYNCRIFDLYGRPVSSFAVLADDSATWRPERYERESLGTHIAMQFPIVKLKDFERRIGELERSNNPFALVVLAHLRTRESNRDNERRFYFKRELIRLAYRSGYTKADIWELLMVIDWLMVLPDNVEKRLEPELEALEMEKEVEFIPYWGRRALKEGLKEGLKQGLQQGVQKGLRLGRQEGALKTARENVIDALRAHFGSVPAPIKKSVKSIEGLAALKLTLKHAVTSSSLDEFKRALGK